VSRAAAVFAATACALALAGTALADGSFQSSDPQLTAIWNASVRTADDAISKPVNLDPRDCDIDLPLVILDSPQRDRCPYVGDLAVTGLTLEASGGDTATLRAMIAWYASQQDAEGEIPASPIFDGTWVLVDYEAYWIEDLYDYTLWTGDLSLLKSVYPNLVRLVDVLYPAHVKNGLLVNWVGHYDYAYIDRGGDTVAYYNAQYARALGMAASLATWNDDAGRASAWLARAAAVKAPFLAAFWDPTAGAFSDTANDDDVHALDGNVFAILAGLASPAQQQSILAYIGRAMTSGIGDTIVDSTAWNSARWGNDATLRVYPFISYFDVMARYAAGADDSALALIRSTWGYMLAKGPGTMWESIDAGTGKPVGNGSYDHGWSSGAAPALTTQVLGVQPTSPGFATFTVTPHPSDLTWAKGVVPTPHGLLRVSWSVAGGKTVVSVLAPPGTTWTNPPTAVSGPLASSSAGADSASSAVAALLVPRTVTATGIAAQLVSQLRRERYVP
jgi:hypothetical protein